MRILRHFRQRLVALQFIAALMAAAFAFGLYFFSVEVLVVGETWALIAAGIVWLYATVFIAQHVIHMATQPVEAMYSALDHLSTEVSDSAPLKAEGAWLSRELTQHVLTDVYNLSSGQHDQQTRLKDVKEFAESIIQLQSSAIIVLDRNLQIKFVNRFATQLMPESIESAAGMQLHDALDIEFASGLTLEEWFAAAHANKIQDRYVWEKVRVTTGSGSIRYFDMAADYNKNESHGAEVILMLMDKTDGYHADDEQVSFVSLAVHELRSPITLLRGYIEVFDDELSDSFDDDQRQFMQKMSVAAGQLSIFVNNILNVARIENDQLKIHIHEDTVYDAINNYKEDFSLRAEVRGRDLVYELGDGIPPIGLDRVAFYEVLSNLIDNAIKYTGEDGRIVVGAAKVPDGGVRITVEDNGIGIPAPSLENLFERFYRSHHSRDKVSGTGLGLFLSKRIVEAHGGTIWVRSTEGKGSTFGFELPSFEAIKNSPLRDGAKADDSEDIVRSAHGWIKNHGKVRR